MEFLLLPLLTVCLLSCSGTTSAQKGATVIKVREGSEAVLPCFISSKQNIAQNIFDWRKDGQSGGKQEVFMYKKGQHYNNGLPGQDEQFKGRVSHFPKQLQVGDASIRINNIKLSDSGNYTCDFSPDEPNGQIFYIKLVVDCILKDRSEENIPGACSEPIIIRHKDTRYCSLLQCDVRGVFPKPEVKWQDSDGNILSTKESNVTESGGRFFITLQTEVTKTGDYYCVATQGEICHQIPAKTNVHIHDSSPGLAADVVVTFAITVFGVLAKCYITQN